MELKGRIVSLVFFFTFICIICIVDLVKASTQKQAQMGQVDLCAGIIGPEWNINKPGKSPCPTLDVWVPKKSGFVEFVRVNEDNEVADGFSIAVFCKAIQFLPFNVRPIFKPFTNERGGMNGTYNQLLQHIEGQASELVESIDMASEPAWFIEMASEVGGFAFRQAINDNNCQAVAGDVTIRADRAQYVSFTIPYLSAEIYMLVHAAHEWNQTLGTFLKPFTTRLWITLVCACILTGIAVALLEYRADNPKFASPFYKQLVMVIWFPISTFFFHEGKINNKCSKVVLVMWLCMIFIVLQIFTATLSSWLTLDQLRPRLPSNHEKIGYQGGSFIRDLIMEIYGCSGKHLKALNSYEEFKDALANGIVDGIVDHLYYIDLFLAKYPYEYTKVGPIHQEAGIAFALPIKSYLLEDFSRAVINVTKSKFMVEMKRKYLGLLPLPNKSQSNQAQALLPQSLDVECFIGLFTFMGIVTIATIILSEILLRHRCSKIGIEEEEECKQQATASEPVQIKMYD